MIDQVTPASVEERSVESPISNEDDHEEINSHIQALEESLRCLKHEINELKARPISAESTEPDNHSNVDTQALEDLKSFLEKKMNELSEDNKLIKEQLENRSANEDIQMNLFIMVKILNHRLSQVSQIAFDELDI